MADKTVTVRLQALVSQYQASMKQATASTQHFGEEAVRTAVKNQQAATRLNLASKSEATRVQAQIQQHQQLMSSFTQVGIAGVAMGGALAFGLKAAADAAIEFESSFAGVRKTVDATEPEFAALAQGLRDMATEIPVNVNELNRIAEAAGQLGVQKDAILAFTETVAKLGVTTTLSSDDAANGLARLMNIMQTAPNQVESVASTIVALGNAGASTEGEILEFGLRIAGAGKIAGLTEANILAIGNAMSSVGVEAEAGGTAVQKVLLGITEAVATGNENLEVFASTSGMSAEKFAKAWEADPGAAFVAFVKGLGAAGTDAFGILEQLGLTDQRLIRSFLSLGGAGDLLTESLDGATKAAAENNALNEEAGKRFETTASQIQLAKNEINDVAISFGEILLPAIAAVAGGLGVFADFINDLPGPLKAVAVVLVAAAAAMLLLGGAALLLLPRIEQTREALFRMVGTTKLLQGSAALAARAFNPWTLAITAATIGIGLWMASSQRAKARVEELTAAIEADSGAIGTNTRAHVANRLEKEGALEAAQQFGLALETVVDAALGDADALAAVELALEGVERGTLKTQPAANLLASSLHGVAVETDAAVAAAKRKEEATGGEAEADKAAADAAGAHANTLSDDLNPALEESVDLTKELKDAFDALAGNQIDSRKALIAYKQGVVDLTKQLGHGTRTLDLNTKAGRDNQTAILKQIDLAIDHGAAVAEESGSLDKGVRSVRDHIRAIADEAVQAGFSKEEIRRYIEQLNLTPKQIRTLIDLDKQKAEEDIQTYLEKLDTLPHRVKVYIETVNVESKEGPGPPPGPPGPHPTDVPHAGGLIGTSGAVRMHGGGWPGMRGDEIPAILQRGELVWSKSQVRQATQLAAAPQLPDIQNVIPVYVGEKLVKEVVIDAVKGEILREAH